MSDDVSARQHPAQQLVVPQRFRGPAGSGNGGWTSGALAQLLRQGVPDDPAGAWPVVRVSLRQPPPLDTPMPLVHDEGRVAATYQGAGALEATVVEDDPVPVSPVDAAAAREAEAAYHGLDSHPFPGCFACGTAREPGDGLRIFPGEVPAENGHRRVAATWTPDGSLTEDRHEGDGAERRATLPVTWAALDCIGGWAGDIGERMMVLGRMTTVVDTLPVIGEAHVVTARHERTEGRKTFTASTLFDADGRVVARAEHVWIAISPDQFPEPGRGAPAPAAAPAPGR